MDEWDEGMEYLEEYGAAEAEAEEEAEAMEDASAGAQGENDADAAITEILNSVDLEKIARDSGSKPANEWERRDFQGLLNNHPELRTLETSELRAIFLVPTDIVDSGIYYRRGNVRDVRRHRANGGTPLYRLADLPIDVDLAAKDPEYAHDVALFKERGKLDAIWQNL